MKSLEQLSWKSNKKHSALEFYIKELDSFQDKSRTSFSNRAIAEAEIVESWDAVRDELVALEIPDVSVPTAMQVKIDESNIEKINTIRKNIARNLGLEIVQIQYMMQLVWMNYLLSLKKKAQQVGESKKTGSQLTGPEMVKRLVQILLMNRKSDAEVIQKIKQILGEWEE